VVDVLPMLLFFCDNRMCNISDNTLSECRGDTTNGVYFWTAGQRKEPSRMYNFVWRVIQNTDASSEKVSKMSYTNWHPDEPRDSFSKVACVNLLSDSSYSWRVNLCSQALCSVCEIEI